MSDVEIESIVAGPETAPESWDVVVEVPIRERAVWLKRLRDCGIKIAPNFSMPSQLIFEAPTSIDDAVAATLDIGAFSYIGPRADIRRATIGRFCSLARDITLGPSEHPTHLVTTHPLAFNPRSWFAHDPYFADLARSTRVRGGPVTIGHDVWIGAGVLVRAGVTIGTGAIVGAKSLVLADVEPYAVVAGTPARVLRHRYDEPTRARLLESRWWDKDLRGPAPVDFADANAFCDQVELLPPTAVLFREKFRVTRTREDTVRFERRLPDIPIR